VTWVSPEDDGVEQRGPEVVTRSAHFGLLVGWEPQLVVQVAVECAAQTHGHATADLDRALELGPDCPWAREQRAALRAGSLKPGRPEPA
jgi:hypothetical protein